MSGPQIAPRDLIPGSMLPNGAVFLAGAPAAAGAGQWVVLAWNGESAQPWVTWACPADDAARTYGGHYYVDPTRAAVEFARRALGRQAVSALV